MDRNTASILIKAVCAVTTDRWTLDVAQWATMRTGGKAEEFLHHYLAGSSLDKVVDILALLRDDVGVRETVEREISIQLKRPGMTVSTGNVALPQSAFKNRDWQYATGSLNMNWRRMASSPPGQVTVELSLGNQYRWHPKEPRVSQCVHQAAENLKQTGAKDYWIVGRPTPYRFTSR